jgi:hypothetical protein
MQMAIKKNLQRILLTVSSALAACAGGGGVEQLLLALTLALAPTGFEFGATSQNAEIQSGNA